VNISFGDLEVDGWSVVWAGVVAVVTLLLARYAARATVRLGGRLSGGPHDVIVQVSRAVRYAVYVFGVGVALSVLGAPIQPVLVALLVVLGAVVLIGRGVADNVGAGLVIQTRRTLKLGDLIESSGHLGHVTDMNSRSVVIDTADGVTVHLPNNDVLNTPLLNYSTRGEHRSELEVAVTSDTGTDPERSMDAARTAAADVRGVSAAPAPATALVSLGPHRAVFRLSVWHDPAAGVEVRSRVTAAVYAGLMSAGISVDVSWPPPPVAARPAAG
jgi:small conductance mechanosensitive channel